MDEILQRNAREVFAPREMNEIILVVYNIIKRAIRDQSDTLTLTRTHFVWTKDGLPVGEFPISLVKPTMTFREAIEMIHSRDEIIREHFRLVADTPDGLSYHID
jgi:hypothetical protein